jgi:Ca-activated chloride channel family protein
MRAGKAFAPGGAAPSLDDVRAIAAIEAGRLAAAAGLPAFERRDLLDDLASRLAVLIGALSAKEFAPLHDLVAVLNGDGTVDEKWTAAVTTLTTFGGDASSQPESPPSPRAFWKR